MSKKMNRRDFLKHSAVGTASISIAGRSTTAAAFGAKGKKRPNVLFVMTDQMRADAAGFAGNSIIKTPNLDKLAEKGVRFSNAFTQCSMCIPARFSLITGRYPHSHGVFHMGPMAEEETSIAEILAEQGYRAAVCGKMHFCNEDSNHGFEFYAYADRPDTKWDIIDKNAYIDYLRSIGKAQYVEEPENKMAWWAPIEGLPAEFSHTAFVTDRAIDFVKEEQEKPWLLYVSYYAPHPPYTPPKPFSEMYDRKDMIVPEYEGLVTNSK
ncbi:sulfatase-like hydrolase/transferase [Candidatus Hydrogenedentota bacterium]